MLLNQDLIVAANTDFPIRFDVISDATGLPIPMGDIEGASWGMTPLEEEVAPLITKDLTNTGEILIPEDGVVIVNISASNTATLSGEFSHELRVRDTANSRVAARGKISIKYQIVNNPL